MADKEAEELLGNDSTEALAEGYDMKRRNRADDAVAMQAVVCILLGAALFAGNIFFPEATGEVIGILRRIAFESSPVIPNPIDMLRSCIDQL